MFDQRGRLKLDTTMLFRATALRRSHLALILSAAISALLCRLWSGGQFADRLCQSGRHHRLVCQRAESGDRHRFQRQQMAQSRISLWRHSEGQRRALSRLRSIQGLDRRPRFVSTLKKTRRRPAGGAHRRRHLRQHPRRARIFTAFSMCILPRWGGTVPSWAPPILNENSMFTLIASIVGGDKIVDGIDKEQGEKRISDWYLKLPSRPFPDLVYRQDQCPFSSMLYHYPPMKLSDSSTDSGSGSGTGPDPDRYPATQTTPSPGSQ